jgi:hypothetical protein
MVIGLWSDVCDNGEFITHAVGVSRIRKYYVDVERRE